MKKDKKFLIVLVSVVILLFSVSMLFSGCGRRARIAEALRDKEAENVEEESIDEDTDTEEVTEEEVTEEEDVDTEEDVDEDEDAGTEESVAVEEDIDDDEGNDVNVEEDIDDDEAIDDDEEVEQPDDAEQFTADIPLVVSECGNVIGDTAHFDPVIYPGDSGEQDLEVRGFISFDTSGLAGATVIESKISATADSLFGKPFVTYGPLIVKAVYWGSRAFSSADCDLDGVELGNYSKKNFGIQNRNLKEDLQRAIDSGSGRYQLIFYFEMDGTDGDGEADSITYYLEDISLNITYTQ